MKTGIRRKLRPNVMKHQRKRGRTRGHNLVAREKERRAWELRKAGAHYDHIAEAVGYNSANAASNAVRRMMNRVVIEATDDIRTVQYERLNFMLMMAWPDIQRGDLRAIETGLRIQDQMNRLMGVEKPVKQEVEHSGGVLVISSNPDDYLRSLKQMAGVIDADSSEITADKVKELVAGPSEEVLDVVSTLGDQEMALRVPQPTLTPDAIRTNGGTNGNKRNGSGKRKKTN